MMRLTQKLSGKVLLRIAALTTAGIALSGCTYDLGLGYASDGYGGGYYDCDPYSQFDSYYDCDNNYGFSNIGYGGGWYDSYWYPGYGFYLFDNYGQRYNMRDNHRRYWGERRHRWYRENRGRHNDGGYRGGRGDHNDGNGGYVNPRQGRGDWGQGAGNDGERNDRRRGDRPRGEGRQRWGNDGSGAVQTPRPDGADGRNSGRGEGRGNRYRPPVAPTENAAQPAAPRREPPQRNQEPDNDAPAPRQGRDAPDRLPD